MRQPFLDVLRGLAVVLMIYTHTLNAWLAPAAQTGPYYRISAMIFALPSRLFLLLMGASLALRLHALRARGASPWSARREALRRGAELVGLGLLLRLEDLRSHGFSEMERLWKVDILNCMGAATIFMALFCLRRDGLPGWRRSLGLALAAVVLAPLSVRWPYPSFLPAPLLAYFYGPRPLAYFPLLPWVAFALLGLGLGDLWQRMIEARGGDAEGRARGRVMTALLLGGPALFWLAVRISPLIPRSPAAVVAIEANPLLFVSSTAAVLFLLGAGYFVTRRFPGIAARERAVMILGQASLPIYFVHLMICYGKIGDRDTGLGVAALGSLGITALMVPLGELWLRVKVLRPSRRKAAKGAG